MSRILVIDDQPHVRTAILAILRSHGFAGVGFENAAVALAAFREEHFDLAIVDLYMPGIDGVKLIKAMRALVPQMPIIAMSGVMLRVSDRSALDFLPDLPGLSDIVCLKKPFRAPELMQAIGQATALAA